MKKKWPLFILFPILLILISILALYIWRSPKKIKDEYIGTEYTFKDIQFDMVTDDFKVNQEAQETFDKRENENVVLYDNEDGDRLLIMRYDDSETLEFNQMEWKEYRNPLRVIYYETISKDAIEEASEILSERGIEITKYKIKTFYGENKKIIYKTIFHSDNSITRYLDVLFENVTYTISVSSQEADDDIQEIIKSINQTN